MSNEDEDGVAQIRRHGGKEGDVVVVVFVRVRRDLLFPLFGICGAGGGARGYHHGSIFTATTIICTVGCNVCVMGMRQLIPQTQMFQPIPHVAVRVGIVGVLRTGDGLHPAGQEGLPVHIGVVDGHLHPGDLVRGSHVGRGLAGHVGRIEGRREGGAAVLSGTWLCGGSEAALGDGGGDLAEVPRGPMVGDDDGGLISLLVGRRSTAASLIAGTAAAGHYPAADTLRRRPSPKGQT